MDKSGGYIGTVAKSFVDAPYGSSFVAGVMGIGGLLYTIYGVLSGGMTTPQALIVGPLAAIVLIALVYVHGRRAWLQERERVRQLECDLDATKPMFVTVFAGIDSMIPDPSVPQHLLNDAKVHVIRTEVVIEQPRRLARQLAGRMVAAQASLLEPPVVNRELDHGYGDERRLNWGSSPILVPQDAKACLFAFELYYSDTVTNQRYRQEWFWMWPGSSKEGLFEAAFSAASTAHTDRMRAYLREHKIPWNKES